MSFALPACKDGFGEAAGGVVIVGDHAGVGQGGLMNPAGRSGDAVQARMIIIGVGSWDRGNGAEAFGTVTGVSGIARQAGNLAGKFKHGGWRLNRGWCVFSRLFETGSHGLTITALKHRAIFSRSFRDEKPRGIDGVRLGSWGGMGKGEWGNGR